MISETDKRIPIAFMLDGQRFRRLGFTDPDGYGFDYFNRNAALKYRTDTKEPGLYVRLYFRNSEKISDDLIAARLQNVAYTLVDLLHEFYGVTGEPECEAICDK